MSRNAFRKAGTITASKAALASSSSRLATALENTLTSSNSVLIDINHDYDEFMELISHVSGSDGQSNVLQLYAARDKNDDYTHVATLTLTVGTAIVRGSSRLYHDTLVVTEIDTGFETVASSSAGNEAVKCWLNTNGYKRFLLVASTLNSTNVAVEYAMTNRQAIPTVS